MKKVLKNVTPPFIYSLLKGIFAKPVRYSPQWVTLSYEPMQGVKMYFDPKGPWQKKLVDNSYDSFFFEKLERMNLEGKTIFDIGAHIGFHSFYFARLVGQRGKVYAFEPNPKNVERIAMMLMENKDLKSVVSVFDIALSDKKGTEEFSLNEDIESGRSSGGFLESADTIWDKEVFKHRGFIKHKVETLALDQTFKELSIPEKPDMLKIDVEGAEFMVLQGARETIEKYHPLILLEVHSMLNMFNVVSFFSSISYEMEILKEESDGRCFIEARPKI